MSALIAAPKTLSETLKDQQAVHSPSKRTHQVLVECRPQHNKAWLPQSSSSQKSLSTGNSAAASGIAKASLARTGSSGLDEHAVGDPFSSLDPIARPAKTPMMQSRQSKGNEPQSAEASPLTKAMGNPAHQTDGTSLVQVSTNHSGDPNKAQDDESKPPESLELRTTLLDR